MAEKMRARLQTPVDKDGKRKDIVLITDSDSVMVDDETLRQRLDELQSGIDKTEKKINSCGTMLVSAVEPIIDDGGRCLWAEIVSPSRDDVDYTYNVYSGEICTEEWIKDMSALLIVANGVDEYDPLSMIKVAELEAFDPDTDWPIGSYVVKELKE